MRVINVSLSELETKVLMIGFEGENQITQVRIDAAEILTDHPNATPTLIAKPLFGFAYPVIVTKEGTEVVWEIDNSVLSFNGDGEIQLTFTEGTVIAKSYVGRIRIKRSLAVNGEKPDPIETWEQAATAKLAEVDAQIGELEDMVEAAEAAKDEAQDIVDDAAADIQAAGAAQVQVVQAKGTEVLNSIPSDYSTLSGEVTDLKSATTLIRNGTVTIPKATAKNIYEKIADKLCHVLVGYSLTSSLSASVGSYVLIVPCENLKTIAYPLFVTGDNFGTGFYDENDSCISGYYNTTEETGTIHTLNVPDNATKCVISIPSGLDAMEWTISVTSDSIDELREDVQTLTKEHNETDLTLKYLLDTECEYKYYSTGDWGEELTAYSGKVFVTTDALGKAVSNVTLSNIAALRNYRIDVSGYKRVAFPAYKSTSNYGELFVDENDIVCGVYTNPTYDSGTIVVIDVPENSKYLYLSRNVNWSQDICFLIGAINALENNGGGSSIIIVHDDSYPSLTTAEKQEIVTLCNDYYGIRSNFVYGGSYRNQYVDSNCISGGKFRINCGNFAQFIWMGRSASDFDSNNYTPYINKDFDWGYYFYFLVHRKCYGIYKNASASTDSEKYYGYQHPTGSNAYSFNTFDNDGNGMQFRPFMAAADLAFELFMLGCEVPRRAVEVGDMIFYRGPEYSGMTNETQLNFRNISHVGICIDNDYNGLGILRVMESTFYDQNGDISIISLDETDVNNRLRAGMYENRIVMCARHPHAFGIPTNVPNAITAI